MEPISHTQIAQLNQLRAMRSNRATGVLKNLIPLVIEDMKNRIKEGSIEGPSSLNHDIVLELITTGKLRLRLRNLRPEFVVNI